MKVIYKMVMAGIGMKKMTICRARRRGSFSPRLAAALVQIAVLAFCVAPASANGMPANWYSENGGHLFPVPVYEDSVVVESETIRFSNLHYNRVDANIVLDLIISMLSNASGRMCLDADITYSLLNTGDMAKSVDIVFPIHRIDELGNPQVIANGKPVPYKVSNPKIDIREFGFEPRQLPKDIYQPEPYGVFKAIEFSVDFEPNERIVLNVKYLQNSGYDGMTKPFFYYLQPARYWKDFSNLDIYVELPGNYSFKSPIGFAKTKKSFWQAQTVYHMHADKLPDCDLEFDVRWERPTVITLICFFAIITALAAVIVQRVHRRRASRKAQP
jgi:hypothetical protein